MSAIAIEELLLHSEKMMLLNKIIRFDEQSMVAEVIVRDDGLFDDGITVPAWLGVEYMAQTIAAHDGMMVKLAKQSLHLGFLLGTRRYTSNVSGFSVGSVLTVFVKRILEDQGLAVFDCKITAENLLVEAKLNVYQPQSEKNLVITE